MSISKSQAKALAEGFLDDLGGDVEKSELQPKETFTELFLLAGEFVEDSQKNLKDSNSNASGGLSNSLILSDPIHTGNVVSVNIMMDFYGQFVNSGVKGTKGGAGKYAFKTEFPSRKMIEALKAGIGRAKVSSANVNKSRTIRANEKKNATISEISKVYGAARNIKMYGIKATGFIDKAVKKTEDKISERLGAAFKTDIINSLQDGEGKQDNI
jgi:hypothetical protein